MSPRLGRCPICDASSGHNPDCGDLARTILARVLILAAEAEIKGDSLQGIPELKLVGNAYLGMAQRIFATLGYPHEWKKQQVIEAFDLIHPRFSEASEPAPPTSVEG